MAISQGYVGKYCYPACIENLKFDAVECGVNGDSALFISVENRHQCTTVFLIENGADVCKCDISGETPFHSVAARNRLKENFKLLIVNEGNLRTSSLDASEDILTVLKLAWRTRLVMDALNLLGGAFEYFFLAGGVMSTPQFLKLFFPDFLNKKIHADSDNFSSFDDGGFITLGLR